MLEILQRLGMMDCKAMTTPMVTELTKLRGYDSILVSDVNELIYTAISSFFFHILLLPHLGILQWYQSIILAQPVHSANMSP